MSIEDSAGREIALNRPYSYFHGCTGNEHEREADAGKSFQMQIISPHEPPSHARSSPTLRIRIILLSTAHFHMLASNHINSITVKIPDPMHKRSRAKLD